MSNTDEILEIFYSDIKQKENQVLNKSGIYPFLDNLDGWQIENFYLDEEDHILLARISERDKLEKEADKILGVDDGNPNKKVRYCLSTGADKLG